MRQPTPKSSSRHPGWVIALAVEIPVLLAAVLLPALAKAKSRCCRIGCENNLRQVGLAFRQYALDNDGKFPFHVSTNNGGTLEFCLPDQDGFDRNSWMHFQVMSNQLTSTRLLVCSRDQAREAASDFSHLQATNVTYRIRSGADVSEDAPAQILVVCPVDGNVVLSDGSVMQVSASKLRELLSAQKHH